MSDKQQGDPLERLRVDAGEVDRKRLSAMLDGLVLVDTEHGEHGKVIYRNGVKDAASNPQLVTLTLLAQRAMHLLDGRVPSTLRPGDIQALTGMPGGSVRSALKRLSDDGLVLRREEGYLVPSHAFDALESLLEGLGD